MKWKEFQPFFQVKFSYQLQKYKQQNLCYFPSTKLKLLNVRFYTLVYWRVFICVMNSHHIYKCNKLESVHRSSVLPLSKVPYQKLRHDSTCVSIPARLMTFLGRRNISSRKKWHRTFMNVKFSQPMLSYEARAFLRWNWPRMEFTKIKRAKRFNVCSLIKTLTFPCTLNELVSWRKGIPFHVW